MPISEPNCKVIETDLASLHGKVDGMDHIIERLADNNTKLITLCAEMKANSDGQERRIGRVEEDHIRNRTQFELDKTEFNNTVRRIHEKIESSEQRGEDKTDEAIKIISLKIDGLTQRFERFEKFKWIIIGGALVIGALFTKFEILKSIFGAT